MPSWYCNDYKFSDRHVWANSVDPDETAPSLIRVYTVCQSVCIFWTYYSVVKRYCASFRIITAIVYFILGFYGNSIVSSIVITLSEEDGASWALCLPILWLFLTHICLIVFSIVIRWTSPFPNLGVSGVFFSFLFDFFIEIPVWSDAAFCRIWAFCGVRFGSALFAYVPFMHIWATSWQNQKNGMCAQRRLRSAWASAQFD